MVSLNEAVLTILCKNGKMTAPQIASEIFGQWGKYLLKDIRIELLSMRKKKIVNCVEFSKREEKKWYLSNGKKRLCEGINNVN